ncbi:50S ribosomal protein L20 [Campylobacter sp. faydin G-105]|uniref:hypothetical protein n=1 Tax=Campylobacter anatolicus TaxID=2829105 RepID=UPI001BA2AF59|nr:hypothetical protein [Campylobacter anatolicus]MBR8462370.1 50S ribosomal protein L20 [Campylobacter anatolicus]
MDYNRENKGFVCFMYNTTSKRAIYFLIACLFGGLAFGFYGLKNEANEFTVASNALFAMSISILITLINPKIFILKLIGFIGALISIAIALHNINLLSKLSEKVVIFNAYFYLLVICGLALLVMLLSWFVYNARSSEINDI